MRCPALLVQVEGETYPFDNSNHMSSGNNLSRVSPRGPRVAIVDMFVAFCDNERNEDDENGQEKEGRSLDTENRLHCC